MINPNYNIVLIFAYAPLWLKGIVGQQRITTNTQGFTYLPFPTYRL